MKLTMFNRNVFIAFIILCLLGSSVILMSYCYVEDDTKKDDQDFKVETMVTGLDMPWATASLPNGDILVTERVGKLRLIKNGELDPQEIKGVPTVVYKGQGGLLDVVLHPDYKKNGWIYLSYSSAKAEGEEGDDRGANTALLRAKLEDHTLTNIQYLFKATPNVKANVHFGGRIVFDGKGYLFLTLGERSQQQNAQNLSKDLGKVIRLHDDGKIPADNPFVGQANARPEIWSYGHRNQQGLVLNTMNGTLWGHEHGPQGGDELNLIEKGKNYGWPLITFGINYDNSIITKDTAAVGMEQPVTYWKPSIAPCGMAFITSDKFKAWKGDLLVGSLKFNHIQHLTLKDNKVVKREIRFEKIGRVRDIRQALDGFIYVVVENTGAVLRISPKS